MAGTSKNQPPSSGKSRSVPVVGIVFAVVAVLAVVAVVFAGNTEIGSEYGEPQVSGRLTPAPQNARADIEATGEMAPIVIGQDFDGNEVRIENDGRAKAIALLAHWCPHCQNEVPAVQAWLESGGGVDGVDMYSVATSMQSTGANYPSSEWLEREGWTVPLVVDDEQNSVYEAYGSGGFPFWVFLNSDGTVAVRMQGSIPISELEQVMEALN
ncbi:MAG: TlpA disulfide reductase family protein [Actinomycetota bacterium]|nr:TlpA disulfide reductase family protein [Actinomycetota bacterium]